MSFYQDRTPPTKGEADRDAAIDEAYDARWWERHDNMVSTADWMADNGYEAKDVALLVEKPWKFTDEFISACEDYAGEVDQPVQQVLARWLGTRTVEVWHYADEEPPVDETQALPEAGYEPDEDAQRGDR
jgi:hypothetical protein